MISLKGVSKITNNGERVILDNIDFEVNQGDYIVIQGGSNSAKKALGRLIGAVDVPTSGELFVDGIEINQYSASELSKLRRDKFSCLFVWQELDSLLSVKENVLLPLMYAGKKSDLRDDLAQRALTIVGMQKFVDANVDKLNYWQKNKVLLARSIVTSPRVLILEEPCRMGDSTKVSEVIGLLEALNNEGITIVVITSREEYAESAKKIIEIENGKLIEKIKIRPLKKETIASKIKKSTRKKSEPKTVDENQANLDVIDIKESEIKHSEISEIAEGEKQLSIDEISVVETKKKTRKSKEK